MIALQSQALDARRRWDDRVAVLVLSACTLLAMGQLCGDDFSFWDDPGTVHQNPWLQPPTIQSLIHYWTTPAGGLYIPVTYTIWAGVALFAHVPKDSYGIALNPWLFHGTNVLCHLLAVLVTYRILRLLRAGAFAAACGALLFGVHPIQVEAVAWVSGLKDVLSGLLALVALWQYILFSLADGQGRSATLRYFLATMAFAVAMLAKPSVMALPLAVVAIDRLGNGRAWGKVLRGTTPWFVLAIPVAFVARRVQDSSHAVLPAIWLRPFIAADALAFYLWKVIWPVSLTIDYGRNPARVIADGQYRWDWMIPVAVAIVLAAAGRRRPIPLAAGVIFVAGCLPVLGFTPAMFQFFSTTADHYLYLSMLGAALAVAWLVSVLPSVFVRFTAVGLLVALIWLSILQGQYWKNDIRLFSHDIRVNPDSYVGYMYLAAAYDREHDMPDVVKTFRAATNVDPEYPMAWENLAHALSEEGNNDEAMAAARRATELKNQYLIIRSGEPGGDKTPDQQLYRPLSK